MSRKIRILAVNWLSISSEKCKLLGTYSYLRRRLFQFPELSGHRTHANPNWPPTCRMSFYRITARRDIAVRAWNPEKFFRKGTLPPPGTLHTYAHCVVLRDVLCQLYSSFLFALRARNVRAMRSTRQNEVKNSKNENEVYRLSQTRVKNKVGK